MVKKYIDAGIALTKFLKAAASLAKQGVKQDDILRTAQKQFGEVSDSLKKQIDDIFEKSPLAKILDRRKAAKKSVEERKVLDMEGKVLDPDQPILGGKQTKMETSDLDDILSGVADKSAQQKKFSERVIKLMDEEGYEFGEAVKEAMKEGYAKGGRIGYGSGTPSKNRFTQLMLLKEEALEKGDMDKVRQIQSDIDKEFGKAQGGRIGYADGTENMMAEIDYSSSAYRFKLIDSLMDTGGYDYGSAVKEADRIIEIKLRPKTKKKLAAGGLPNILGY